MIQTVMVGPRVSVDGGPVQHSYYFRKKFTVAGPVVPSVLRFAGRIDDGIIIFLNGNRVYHLRITNDTPLVYASSDLATGYACGGDPDCGDDVFDAPAIGLTEGENVLAVILMQEGTDSSDMTFGLGISDIFPATAPTITDSTEPRDRIAPQNQTVRLIAIATGIPTPNYQWYKDDVLIEGATGTNYTIQSMQPGDAGLYYCRISNFAGTVDSRTANLQFTDDTFPPTVVNIVPANSSSIVVEFNESMLGASGGGLFTEDPFSYTLAGGTMDSQVSGVVLNPDGVSVTLTVAPDLEPDTDFTVDLGGDISDLAGNLIVPIVIPFRSWVPTTSPGVIFEAFDTSSVTPAGNAVVNLTSHPNYPNNPRDVSILTGMDSRLDPLYSTDANENYGARIRTVFIPPSSGNWIFYLWADDGAQLFVNPTGPGETGKQLLLDRTACCGTFASANSQSAPQNLNAGQAYYVEALYKEGIGGDYGKVIALREGQPVPATADAGLLAPVAAPSGVAGTFTINQPPASQNTVPNSTVTFSVGTTTDVPLSYQWMRDGVDIPNAAGAVSIGPRYSLFTTVGDDGARFSVRVSIIGGPTITSAEALLSVAPDTIRPTVVSAATTAAGTSVVVTYSEGMGASADAPAAYSINGSAPSAVTRTSSTVFTLTPVAAFQDCVANVLTITGAADTSGNLINPNPASVTFTKPQVLVGNTGTQIWRFEDTGADLLTAWLAPGYDDSGWAFGPGPLGLEDAAQMPAGWEIRTPTPNYVASRITYYFRTHFNLATAPASVTRLQLTQVVDDGSIVWLNGQLLSTLRMTTPAAYATLSGGSAEPHPIETADVPTTALQYGDNVLAVEVHQSGTASSDLVFGAELTATVSACVPPLTITRSGSNQATLTWPEGAFPGYRLESSPSVTGPWGPQAGSSGVTVSTASGNRYFRLANP
jgi:hypothetical protein